MILRYVIAQERLNDLFFYSVFAQIDQRSFRNPYCTRSLFYLERTKMEKSFLNSKPLKFHGFSFVSINSRYRTWYFLQI